jgi:molybdenum cofactor cytidylyltransferase
MFLVGDQPYLSSATINTLIDIFKRERHPVVVPIYAGKRGNPVIFSSELKDALYKLQGDCGGRVIIDQMPESVKLVNIENSLEGVDIDTQEAYEKVRCQQYPGA